MAKGERRVGIYLRVSTSEQTTDNQRRELEAVAERHAWTVVRVFEDAGISWRQRSGRPAWPRCLDESRRTPGNRYGRGLVGRSARSIIDRSSDAAQGFARKGRRSVPSSTGSRHVHAFRAGDVPDARRVCGIRAGHDPGARDVGLGSRP